MSKRRPVPPPAPICWPPAADAPPPQAAAPFSRSPDDETTEETGEFISPCSTPPGRTSRRPNWRAHLPPEAVLLPTDPQHQLAMRYEMHGGINRSCLAED